MEKKAPHQNVVDDSRELTNPAKMQAGKEAVSLLRQKKRTVKLPHRTGIAKNGSAGLRNIQSNESTIAKSYSSSLSFTCSKLLLEVAACLSAQSWSLEVVATLSAQGWLHSDATHDDDANDGGFLLQKKRLLQCNSLCNASLNWGSW